MEIQVGMLRADMVKDAGDRPPHAGIETFHRIDVDRVANIFVAGMLHGRKRCSDATFRAWSRATMFGAFEGFDT